MELESITEPASFRCSRLGTISGEFYLRVGNSFFPEERWTDLVLPVANAWLGASQELLRGTSWQEWVRFMDGPFWVDLAMTNEGGVIVRLVEGRLRGDLIRHSLEVSPTLLLQDAVVTATRVLKECRLRGWSNSDTAAIVCRLNDASRQAT
jgi:hypothetical protein